MAKFHIKHWLRKRSDAFLISTSVDKDLARRELILNILLLSSFLLSCIAAITSWMVSIAQGNFFRLESIEISLITLLFFVAYVLSRRGKSRWSSYFFIFFYLLLNIHSSFKWGATNPQSLLTYALIVIMAGILVGSRFSFIVTTIISLVLVFLTHRQDANVMYSNTYWNSNITVRDGIVFSVTLYVIAIVSWLFNREGEKALERARVSEVALRRQQVDLEVMVQKRTKQLQMAQAEKLAQVYTFAEFGRSASGLFHDLVNPLTVVSFNLHQLKGTTSFQSKQSLLEVKEALGRAIKGTKRLEAFIAAARAQLQHISKDKQFSLSKEISQAVLLLEYKAKIAQVKIVVSVDRNISMFGNSIKFGQLITNLVSNAVDSYEGTKKKKRRIEVSLVQQKKFAQLIVEDWGSGIEKQHMAKIFDPLFTTKDKRKGTGLGLTICKEIIENDFLGTCQVESIRGQGTRFIIRFPLRQRSLL